MDDGCIDFIASFTGRDRRAEEDPDADPVQNDWNGSAKGALISLERSEAAWRLIADATRQDMPASLASAVGDLRQLVEEEFPAAVRLSVRASTNRTDRPAW